MYESELIEKAGLTAGESKVYLALLEIGASSAGPIIDKSGVARSFIYNILNGLIEKGLVAYVLKDGTRIYQAAEPSRLIDYIERRKQELDSQKEKLQLMLPKLLLLQNGAPSTNVAFFEGFAGFQTCFERYEQKLKRGDEYLCMGILAQQDEKYHAYWKRHHAARVKQGVRARMIFDRKTDKSVMENRNSYAMCDTRYFPSDIQTPVWFFIYADVVGLFSQSEQPFAIEITNLEVAQTFRQYFEDYWRQTVPYVSVKTAKNSMKSNSKK